MEVMDGECGDGAEKKPSSREQMVDELMVSAGMERGRSIEAAARWWGT